MKTINTNSLSENWNSIINLERTQKIGAEQLEDKDCLGIRVPSAIIEFEFNIVLNPNFDNYELIKVMSVDKYNIDERLLR